MDEVSFKLRRFPASVLFLLLLGQIVGLFLAFEQTAQAYVDPGSGLMALQILGASVAGTFYLLRNRARSWFRRSKRARRVEAGITDAALPLTGHTRPLGLDRKTENRGE
jgi:hypothetical protein